LRAAAREAVARGVAVHTGLYRQDGAEIPLRLDLVLPLLAGGSPARGVLVLRIDPRHVLLPMLQSVAKSPTGARARLWQRTGPQVQALDDAAAAPTAKPTPRSLADWAAAAWPAAMALRGAWPEGEARTSLDEQGLAVLAVARPVKGTQAWLVGQIDLATVQAPARRSARWTLGVAGLLLLGIALASCLGLQRLRQQQREHAGERDRLQALGLLEAVTNSATDAIFAKDLQGR
jgi:hypothetical protein